MQRCLSRSVLACAMPLLLLVSAQAQILSVDRADANLRTIDLVTAATTDTVAMTLSGSTIDGGTGLARHPGTGVLWAVLKIDGNNSMRELVTVDEDTGVCTSVGTLPDRFAAIDFTTAPVRLIGLDTTVTGAMRRTG